MRKESKTLKKRQKMKAVILKSIEGKKFSIEDVDEPIVKSNDVKIKVEAAGICGTDIHISEGEFNATLPLILGHEFSGTVVEIGDCVSNIKVGDRVTAESVIYSCGKCEYCISGHYSICKERKAIGVQFNGAFAEYVLVPHEKVFKLYDNIDFISAALTELLACCVHGLVEETNISAGDRVLISGPGPIGLLALQVAKIQGGEIAICGIEQDSKRLNLARELGAKHTFILPNKNFEKEIMELTDNYGVDVAVECSGSNSSLNNCINLLKRKGKLVHIGIFPGKVLYDVNQAMFKEIKIIPTFSHIRSSWELSLRFMAEGLIKTSPLVSHTFSIDNWEEAYKISKSHKGIKIIILPQVQLKKKKERD